MGELKRRVHFLLDDERTEWLRKRAEATGTSVGAVIRSAIDRDRAASGAELEARRAAADALLAAKPYPIGDPEELKRDLYEPDGREPR